MPSNATTLIRPSHYLLASLLITLLTGCGKEGGKCVYNDFEETHQIAFINDNEIGLNSPLLPVISKDRFSNTPKIGDTIKVKGARMIEGSCNPLTIKSVDIINTPK